MQEKVDGADAASSASLTATVEVSVRLDEILTPLRQCGPFGPKQGDEGGRRRFERDHAALAGVDADQAVELALMFIRTMFEHHEIEIEGEK